MPLSQQPRAIRKKNTHPNFLFVKDCFSEVDLARKRFAFTFVKPLSTRKLIDAECNSKTSTFLHELINSLFIFRSSSWWLFE